MKTFTIRLKGGTGSGHHGHKGIPGHQGGSLPADSSASAIGDMYFNNSMSIRDLSDQVVKRYGKSLFVHMYGSDKKAFISDLKSKLKNSGVSLTLDEQRDLFSEMDRQYDWYSNRMEIEGIEPIKPVESSATALSKLASEKNLTDEGARKYVTEVVDSMKKAGLHPYVSGNYSDSKVGGLNKFASNTVNWTISDGDYKSKIESAAKPGEFKLGVAIYGDKDGVKYYDRDDGTFDIIEESARRVGLRIKRALELSGLKIKDIYPAHWDSGYGTRDVGYSITIDKIG